jgi:hypothetical protein
MLDSIIRRSHAEIRPNWAINVESASINSFMSKAKYGFNFDDFTVTQ